MTSIVVFMRDGSKADHPHQGRGGGSYTKHVKYEGGFVVITDEWGQQVAYPQELVARVETKEDRW